MPYTLTNDAWVSAGFLRRLRSDGDPLDAIRGIFVGTVLSILAFWMPLAITLTR